MSTLDIELELWQRYRDHGDCDARDRLFLHYVPWATGIARGVHYRVRAYQVDRDDFIQNATIGLLEAMSRYDPTRGVPFRSYAQPRVRGAVFNGLRSILGDRPTPSDESRFAARLESFQDDGSDGNAFENIVASIVGLGIGFLLDEATEGQAANDVLTRVEQSEIASALVLAVAHLPDRLKLIIQSHYFQHVPFQELASKLGLTKGRISQLHKAALMELKRDLRKAGRHEY